MKVGDFRRTLLVSVSGLALGVVAIAAVPADNVMSLDSLVAGESKTTVVNLKTEYMVNPVGIDTDRPRLSWQLVADRRGASQTAYRIHVAESRASLVSGTDVVWDSGKVESFESIHREYRGPRLRSGVRYHWSVRIWDEHGRATAWSPPALWEMGLLDPSDWRASWIEPVDTAWACPLMRSTFEVDGAVESARVYATALGLYEMELNGHRVGDQLFTPGWTSYSERLQYQTYDVTGLLIPGENAIGVTLGNGWYRGDLYTGSGVAGEYYGDRLALLVQLKIRYEDGRVQTVGTDDGWRSATGPIVESELYDGEVYDARLERRGWSRAEYDDRGWSIVRTIDHSKDILVAPAAPPVRRIEELAPVEILKTPSGEVVFDMGQNMVGWVRLKVRGEAGTAVALRHAEVLDAGGNLYTENLRQAAQTDRYILRGSGDEVFEPHFTVHGFRYVAVDGYPGIPTLDSLTGVVIHSDLTRTGRFESSNPMINQLQHNIVWGQKGNFLDVPTDCPQRDERLGWTGDAQVFAGTAAFNMDVAGFFTKWLADLAADQYETGSIPFVVPDTLRRGNAGAGGSAAWGDAAVIVPWTIYLRYGDTRILEQQYESMKSWVEFMKRRAGDGLIWNTGYHFGDWLAYASPDDPSYPGATTDKDLIATAYFARSTDLLGRIARILGKDGDAERYASLAESIKTAFNEEFVTPSGRVASNTQTGYTLALAFELLPENARHQAASRLAADVRIHNNHITTGFVGTPHIAHELSRFGQLSAAYDLLNQKAYPSWLYPITRGATTIWERWDGVRPDGSFQRPTMNSFNHYAYGSIGDWLYRVVAGLEVDPEEPGYRHALIQPRPGGGLSHARAELDTMYGELTSAWRLSGSDFELEVMVPANTRATVRLPNAVLAEVTESGRTLDGTAGIQGAVQGPDSVVVRVGSGSYRLRYPASGVVAASAQGGGFSIDTQLLELVGNREARVILAKYLAGPMAHPWINQAMTLSLREVAEFSFMPAPPDPEMLQKIDEELRAIVK